MSDPAALFFVLGWGLAFLLGIGVGAWGVGSIYYRAHREDIWMRRASGIP